MYKKAFERVLKRVLLTKLAGAEDFKEISAKDDVSSNINFGNPELDKDNLNFPIKDPNKPAGIGTWYENYVHPEFPGSYPLSYMGALEKNNTGNGTFDSPSYWFNAAADEVFKPKPGQAVTKQQEANIGRMRSLDRATMFAPFGSAPFNAWYNLFEKARGLNRRKYDETGNIKYRGSWKDEYPKLYEDIQPYYDNLPPAQQKDVDRWVPTSYNSGAKPKKIYG